jgi:dipeptidyl aminopeptidase/acylaminoacyl peptidase
VSSIRHRFVLLAGVAVALLGAGCAEIGQPYLGEGVSATSTTIATEDLEDVPQDEIVSANVSAVYSPPRPDGYVPVLLASLGSTLVLVEDGVVTDLGARFPGASVDRIADDFLGGLVAQLEGDVIQWLPADGDAPTLISRGNGSLLDVGFVDDTLAVQAFLEVAGGIDRVKLVDGEREPFTRFEDGASVVAFSSSNGIQAIAIGDAACGALAFFNTSGQRIDLGGPSDPECPVPRRPHFGAVAMSPGGDVVAYTEVEYRDDGLPASTTLTVLELESGSVLLAEQVGTPGEQIESLSYDGRRLAFLRTGETGRQVGFVTVADQAETILQGLEGVQDVSFARLPLLLAVTVDDEPVDEAPVVPEEN